MDGVHDVESIVQRGSNLKVVLALVASRQWWLVALRELVSISIG